GAHGAAYEMGPEIFRRLGAEVTVIGAEPDGLNINEEVGATSPAAIQELTQQIHADIGISFDGDADRAIFSDSEGMLINGDRMMAMWCAHWEQHGRLEPKAVIGTVMSNTGFELAMQRRGIAVTRTQVGDKYVSKALAE